MIKSGIVDEDMNVLARCRRVTYKHQLEEQPSIHAVRGTSQNKRDLKRTTLQVCSQVCTD
jgi:hypothetical protein